MFGLPDVRILLLSLPAVLWAITFHEFCHGYTAFRLGDPTAKRAGRLTLNPLAHLDPVGALMLLLFRFGWAKPVPVEPRYFKNPARDMALVSVAGSAGNFLTALVCGIVFRVMPQPFIAMPSLLTLLQLMILINLGLGTFNLIPIPPLDGSKLLYLVLPPRWLQSYFWIERYGFFILIFLLMFGVIQRIIGPVIWALHNLVLGL